MVMKYAVKVLQEEAFKLGGEILVEQAAKAHIESAGEVEKLAHQILTSSFVDTIRTERLDRFIELLRAIRVLNEHSD